MGLDDLVGTGSLPSLPDIQSGGSATIRISSIILLKSGLLNLSRRAPRLSHIGRFVHGLGLRR